MLRLRPNGDGSRTISDFKGVVPRDVPDVALQPFLARPSSSQGLRREQRLTRAGSSRLIPVQVGDAQAALVAAGAQLRAVSAGPIQAADVRLEGRPTGEVRFVSALIEFWAFEPQDACVLLGYDRLDWPFVSEILSGVRTLRGRDARDRIGALVRIRTLLSSLLRDRETERQWMREAHPELSANSPKDILLGDGAMESLLRLKEYVEYISRL